MTLLVDPPLLVTMNAVIERMVVDQRWRRGLQAAATATVMATGMAFYVNARWTRPLWRLLAVESGRDWMLNSWIFHVEHEDPPPVVDLAAGAAFALYPAWARLGQRLGNVHRAPREREPAASRR